MLVDLRSGLGHMLHCFNHLSGLFALCTHTLPCALNHCTQRGGGRIKLLHIAADPPHKTAQRLQHQVDGAAELAQLILPT
ncbi:hypothetical protein D3C75_1233450 [compost metagenome]